MDFAEVVRGRRSIRSFRADQPQPEAIDRIIDTARRAPSAGFSQGLDFLVLDNSETNERFWKLTEHPDFGSQIDDNRPPVLVIVLSDPQRYLARYSTDDKIEFGLDDLDRWPVRFWDVDAGMASMQLQLAAIDEGLGTWFFGIVYGEDAVRVEFEIPDDRNITGVIALGYRDAGEVAAGSGTSRRRRPLDEQLHRNTW